VLRRLPCGAGHGGGGNLAHAPPEPEELCSPADSERRLSKPLATCFKERTRNLICTDSRAIYMQGPHRLHGICFTDVTDDHGRFRGSIEDFAKYSVGG